MACWLVALSLDKMGPDSQLNLEKQIIRALCLGASDGSVKEALLPMLRDYPWRAELHQVLFDALASIPSADPEVLRQMLPAKLTRLGFPDVDWEEFFTPISVSGSEVIILARRLLAGAQPS